MRILVIGATGTIGKPVAEQLASKGNEVIAATAKSTPLTVNIADEKSIRAMYAKVGKVDAIVCAAGNAKFAPLAQLTDGDFEFSLHDKLMGQVNVIRLGIEHVSDGGSITVTSGVLSHSPMPGSAAISLVNAGLEGFARAAALEAPQGVRINVVSPPWAVETLQAYKLNLPGGRPAAEIASLYVQAVEGRASGSVIEFPES